MLTPTGRPAKRAWPNTRWCCAFKTSAQQLPDTRQVCIGERESDMLELMLKARDLGYPGDYLVRSQHNRVLPGGAKL